MHTAEIGQALEQVNRAGAAFGVPPLKRFSAGIPHHTQHCTLAKAMPFVLHVCAHSVIVEHLRSAMKLGAAWDTPFAAAPGGYEVMLPAVLERFAVEIGAGKYPSLILAAPRPLAA